MARPRGLEVVHARAPHADQIVAVAVGSVTRFSGGCGVCNVHGVNGQALLWLNRMRLPDGSRNAQSLTPYG
jgi:hypothetical protein